MLPMPIGDLNSIAAELTESKGRIKVLWQQPESLAFVARGREYRSEFHIDPVDEVMYMIKGEMSLHYRMPDGSEEVTILKKGCSIYTAAGIPYSPRFPPDAFLLLIERQSRDGEVDRFQWYYPECDELLHEEQFIVNDYKSDPVSKAYANFFNSLERRTCQACGDIMPNPL